jgi:hypothetical protein
MLRLNGNVWLISGEEGRYCRGLFLSSTLLFRRDYDFVWSLVEVIVEFNSGTFIITFSLNKSML